MEIDKEYRPDKVEERWYSEWIARGLFVARPGSERLPFCMVIPPPNVTGSLHMGHVLVYTLHDVMARWRRMQGRDVLWLPGTDHAGIATQMVVERALAEEGADRHSMGREAFEARVWEWKDTYGRRITDSLRGLGASCDWTRERFTLDEGLSRAVRTVFVRLYHEGLIYRDRYIVQWCPRCDTAISDLETIHQEVAGKLYRIRYPAAEGLPAGIEVATTRPETMLGDTAVAVHPDDPRYEAWVGRSVVVPLSGRRIPVCADPFVDPSFGTGAVKVTPAHDPNDFEIARRQGLASIVILDTKARMTVEAGEFSGLDRFEARARIVRRLEEQGLLVDVRDHVHAVGHCQRCGTAIEPLLSTQWFVRVGPLAAPAIAAVEQGRISFVPASWSKTYFEWMRNVHDWCISRQLWWGHRIPAWYCDPCGSVEVAETAPLQCGRCGGSLRQDPDVLDTWFSSALWPFSTLGWSNDSEDLARYYPTDLLITGFDIIFFWVARMIMMGLKFMGDVPFREVYIHGLVRDAQGQKMSKSKGNAVDPEDLHRRYGTDAVRFTMAILAAPGNDIPLAPERMDGYRAFANKLWNACRFVRMRIGAEAARVPYGREELSLADRWILSGVQRQIVAVDLALGQYRFDRAADSLYHFVWHQFCDWYIECVKPDLGKPIDARRTVVVQSVLLDALDTLLRLLHPFMPFITEELWQKLPHQGEYLASSAWPRVAPGEIDEDAEREMEFLQELVVKVRNLRAEAGIDPSRTIRVLVHPTVEATARLVERQAPLMASLARATSVEAVGGLDEGLVGVRGLVRDAEIAVLLAGGMDVDGERARLTKELDRTDTNLVASGRKLANEEFVSRAPAAVVERERRLERELQEKKGRIERTLAALGDRGTSG